MTQLTSPKEPTISGFPETLFGYRVLGLLAHGAGSTLYYVVPRQGSGVQVLKHVVVREKRDHRFVEQLRNEHKVGSAIDHPGIRKVLELKVSRGMLGGAATEAALVLEHCDGYTLEERTPVENIERLGVFYRAAVALHALHQRGYLHCDLKPSNLVVRALAQSTLIDLGQACPIGAAKERVQGTPNFMAPEQLERKPLSPQTDVYGFGATLYKALTQQGLPTAITTGKRARALDQLLTPPNKIEPSVPQELSDLVLDCVRSDPARRPLSMGEIVDRLKAMGKRILSDQVSRG